jgi:hypothetical protein
MKRLLSLVILLAILLSCSDEETVAPPEPCTPFFHAESLQVEIDRIYLPLIGIHVWTTEATYKYRLEGCSGKIHTHEFSFREVTETFVDYDGSIADCFEPTDIDLYKTVGDLTSDDEIFTGYDSVTVYFTLRGLFQQCYGGSADSIDAIVWSDSVRVRLND